jgi:hypothetical protein
MAPFGVKVAGAYGQIAKTHQRPNARGATVGSSRVKGRLGQSMTASSPPMSTRCPVYCDRPDEIGALMRSKSEAWG